MLIARVLLNLSHHPFPLNGFIGLVSRVFTNGPRDWGSVPGRIIKKWYLISPCLTLGIIRYASRVQWNNTREGVAPSSYILVLKLLKSEPSDRS